MYGIINDSFRKYVIEDCGEDTWQKILDVAMVHQDVFIQMRLHDDQETLTLLNATVQVTGDPLNQHLNRFGRFWVRRIATNQFRGLIDDYGDGFYTLVGNLNLMHRKISKTFLDYSPPIFHIRHIHSVNYHVTYKSHRVGLTAFAIGILEELAVFYNEQLAIISIDTPSDEAGETSEISLELLPSLIVD